MTTLMKSPLAFALLLVCLIDGTATAAEGAPANDGDGTAPDLIEEIDDELLLSPPYPQPLKYQDVWWHEDAFGTPATKVTGVTVTDNFLFFTLHCNEDFVQSRDAKSFFRHVFPKRPTPTFYFSQRNARSFKTGDEELTVELRPKYWLGSYALKVRYVKNGIARVVWVSPILGDTLQRVNDMLQDEHKKRPAFARHGGILAVEWRADNPPVDKLDAFPEDAAPWDWLKGLLPEVTFLNQFEGRFDLKFRAAERFMRQVPASEVAADGTLVLTIEPEDRFYHSRNGRHRMDFTYSSLGQLPPYIRWSLREVFGDSFPDRHVGYSSFASTFYGHGNFTEYDFLAHRDSLFLRLQEGEAAKLRQAAEKGIVRVQEFPQGCFIRFADAVFWYDPRLKPDDENQLFRVERRRFTGGTDELFPTYGPWLRHELNAATVAKEATWTSEIARRADRYAVVVAESCQEANAQGGDLAVAGAAILARVAAGASRAAATGAAFVAAQSKAAGTNGTPEAAATAKAMREAARMALKIAMAAQSHAQARMAATR